MEQLTLAPMPPDNQPAPKHKRHIGRAIGLGILILIAGAITFFNGPTWFFDMMSSRQADFIATDFAWGGGKSEIIVWQNHVVEWTRNHGLKRSIYLLSSNEMRQLDNQAVAYMNFTQQCTAKTAQPKNTNSTTTNTSTPTPPANAPSSGPTTFSIESIGVCIDCAALDYRYSSSQASFTSNGNLDSCGMSDRDELGKMDSIIMGDRKY